jgi:hypothetical protein
MATFTTALQPFARQLGLPEVQSRGFGDPAMG